MDLDKITAEQFDRLARQISVEISDETTNVETLAMGRLAQDSVIGGQAAKQASALLRQDIQNELWRRQVAANTFFFGARFGWHLRRMVEQEEILNGMLSPEEEDRLRREIREATA